MHDRHTARLDLNGDSIPFEADAATLRLARRGKTMYYLVAERDSPHFRLIGKEILSDADLRDNPEVELQVGTKKMSMRAETAVGGERDRLWSKMGMMYDG